jgi:hypothetical protein
VGASGTLVFAPGVTSRTIPVQIIGDTLMEPVESFFVDLSNPVNATIADGRAVVVLNIDGDSVPQPNLFISDATITEGDGGTQAMQFQVVRQVFLSPDQMQTSIKVDYATGNGTALAGADYVASSGTLTFAANETVKIVSIPIIGDLAFEPTETFTLQLSNVAGAILQDSLGVGTILDNDSAMMAAGTQSGNLAPGIPSDEELDLIVAAAMEQWAQVLGAGDPRLEELSRTSVSFVDLAGETLGVTAGQVITIDADAADHGWFVDTSPFDSDEFGVRLEEDVLGSARSSEAFGRMDLLTVVTHELGHVLGFDHDDVALYAVMREELDPGVRYVLNGSSLDAGPYGVTLDQGTARHAPSFDFSDGGGTQGTIDWHARADGVWGARSWAFTSTRANEGASSNFSDFLVKYVRTDRSPSDGSDADYDQLGATLLKSGKPTKLGKGLF